MKNFLKPAYFLVLFVLLPVQLYAAYPGAVYISLIKGDVQMNAGDTGEWVPAALNTPVIEGDRLWVPDRGRLEMHLIDGSYVRLDAGTSMDLLIADRTSFQFYLGVGHTYVDFTGEEGTVMQMETPVASIRTYDRAKFRVDILEDGYTQVSVFRGLVYAENLQGRTTVSAGETLLLNQASAALGELGPADEWEQWNRDRDWSLAAAAGPAEEYLPSDLRVYSDEFDGYGRWIYMSGYGYCWTPNGVSRGWAPYRIGRWAWIGGDYVWISHEPWGWVPFHYGRWLFRPSIGWCWVPPARDNVYWGPGYVAWVHSANYVSWCPLAPREIYYGHGHFGRYSVDISRIGHRRIDVRRAYRNIHMRSAVTVISRKGFAAGRMEIARVRQNPFFVKGAEFGRPRIKPSKTSLMPVIKRIPERYVVPRSIRVRREAHLRKTRPLVRRRDESVFKPGVAPKRMFLRRTERELPRERPRIEHRRGTRKQGHVSEQKVRREEPRPAPVRKLRPETQKVAPKGRPGIQEQGVTPERRLRPEQRRPAPVQKLRPETQKVAPTGRPGTRERRVTPERRLRPEQRRPAPTKGLRHEERKAIPEQRGRPETRRALPGRGPAGEKAKSRVREERREEKRSPKGSGEKKPDTPQRQGSSFETR